MAVRGINPLEKHVEKIFLALAAAGLTGVVAWQVAGGSGTVEVNKEQVPADQAYAKLKTKADNLQSQMREASPNTPEKLKQATDLGVAFQKQLAGDIAPNKEWAFKPANTSPIGPDKGPGTTTTPDQFFLPPNLPMAVKPIAHPFMSTVSDADVTAIAELAKFVPAKAPFDKAAVSVETSIDPKAIRAALEADTDGPDKPGQPLLRAWWAGTEVVAVELVRQELKADGTWGGEVATAVLPGRKNFVADLSDPAIDTNKLAQITFDASAGMEELLRPEWYRRAELAGFVVGEEWKTPGEIAKAGDQVGNGPLDDAQKSLKQAKQELTRLDDQIAKVKAAPAPRPPVGGGIDGGGGGGRRAGGAGGGGGGGAGGVPAKDPKEEQIKTLEKRREQVLKRIADFETKIADLGGKADADATKPIVKDSDLGVLLSQTDPITVWHHDIEAVRGATYRYQVRIKLNNPLFNRGTSQLKPEHAAAAKSPTIAIPCADWSDPVRVDDEVYCFITGANTGANAGGSTGMGTAQATLLYFTWGYWRGANISLEPGDGMIARWTVPDETKITAAPAAGAPPAPVAPGQGGGRRPGGAIGAGGAVGAGAPAVPNAPAAPANAALATKEITKERDAFLLDVIANPVTRAAAGAGSAKLSFLALIRDIDKAIIARDPEIEKASLLYRRLEASVLAGREQLKGAGVAAPVGGQAPAPNQPNIPIDPRRGGGVGGG